MRVEVVFQGYEEALKRYADRQKSVKFAAAVALTRGAVKGREVSRAAMESTFDRPTPWVLGSVRFIKATPANLEAKVDFDQWGNKQGVTVSQVLKAEIFGGQRRLKRHERALASVGVLPSGMAVVPGPGASIDGYGNMSAGQINQITAWFRAFPETGYRANITAAGRRRLAKGSRRRGVRGFEYFAMQRSRCRLVPGIYQRFSFGALGSSVRAVMFFVPTPSYRKAFQFYDIAERAARREFQQQFPIALEEAMAGAR